MPSSLPSFPNCFTGFGHKLVLAQWVNAVVFYCCRSNERNSIFFPHDSILELLFIAFPQCSINILQLEFQVVQVLRLLMLRSIEIDFDIKTDARINVFGQRTANEKYLVAICYIIKLTIFTRLQCHSKFLVMMLLSLQDNKALKYTSTSTTVLLIEI